jgi:hypothetical protein
MVKTDVSVSRPVQVAPQALCVLIVVGRAFRRNEVPEHKRHVYVAVVVHEQRAGRYRGELVGELGGEGARGDVEFVLDELTPVDADQRDRIGELGLVVGCELGRRDGHGADLLGVRAWRTCFRTGHTGVN